MSVTLDNSLVSLDASVVLDGEDVFVPAKNILNNMDIELTYSGDTFTAVREDGKSMEVTLGESEMKANGQAFEIKEPYLYEDAVLMVPFKALENAFGTTISNIDEENKKIDIKTNYTPPKYETSPIWWWANTKFTGYKDSVSYEINLPENSDIKVMYKLTGDTNVTYDKEEKLYYRAAPKPQYVDGKWRGAFSTSLSGKYYGVKIIADGKIYLKTNAVSTKDRNVHTYEEYIAIESDSLNLVPTYECVSYYYESNAEDVNVYYKKSSDTVWKKAYRPYKDENANVQQFRGSIVNLTSNCEYDVKIEELSDGEVIGEYTESFKTWNENPPIAKTIPLSQLYSGGSLLIRDIQGTPDGWIKIVGNDDTPILADGNIKDAVLFDDCQYVIFENVTVVGGSRNGINMTDTCNNIRIINCDISGWGRKGVFYPNEGLYKLDGDVPNYIATVRIHHADSVTVERCFIHDPKGGANFWDGEHYQNVHPNGPSGIYYRDSNAIVIRYNDFVGNDEHLFNDAIESCGNSDIGGGVGKNADIYGNFFANGADDGTELDGSQMNVRFFRNRVENFLCGVSTVSSTVGPSYIYENQISGLNESKSYSGGAIKAGGSGDSNFPGKLFVFNNTIDVPGYGITNVGGDYHIESRNNIIGAEKRESISFKGTVSEQDTIDYDILWRTTNIPSSITGKNIKYAKAEYMDKDSGDFRLTAQSPGKGKSQVLDNFGGGKDAGVYGNSDISFMPYRPIKATADKYRVLLNPGETTTVNVTFENPVSGFEVDKTGNWIFVSDAEVSDDGKTVTVEIGADADLCKNNVAYGGVMIRLENGYSIPIWVGMNLN